MSAELNKEREKDTDSMIKIRLEELCEERKVSLYRVKEDTGIEYTTLHRYKSNQTKGIQLAHIEKLCNFFDVSPAELFKISHKRKANE